MKYLRESENGKDVARSITGSLSPSTATRFFEMIMNEFSSIAKVLHYVGELGNLSAIQNGIF